MTGEDLFPFGKHKGTKLKDVPAAYIRWWLQQDWAPEKKDLYAYYTKGVEATSTPKEREEVAVEEGIMSAADPAFKTWWFAQYEKRLRGSDLYLAHLRVAIAAWTGAVHHFNNQAEKEITSDTIDDLSSVDTEESDGGDSVPPEDKIYF